MATKKKAPAGGPAGGAAYEQAVQDYAAALETMRKGDFAKAQPLFQAVADGDHDEPTLADRARTYARICAQKLAESAPAPEGSEDRYLRAVYLLNEGRADEAVELLDLALRDNPASARFFYARASAHALKRRADKAVDDLRQAIAIDPTTRFQAVNDADFEGIREEPAFIDIIEPTPAGA